jgi:hypothetical protein
MRRCYIYYCAGSRKRRRTTLTRSSTAALMPIFALSRRAWSCQNQSGSAIHQQPLPAGSSRLFPTYLQFPFTAQGTMWRLLRSTRQPALINPTYPGFALKLRLSSINVPGGWKFFLQSWRLHQYIFFLVRWAASIGSVSVAISLPQSGGRVTSTARSLNFIASSRKDLVSIS